MPITEREGEREGERGESERRGRDGKWKGGEKRRPRRKSGRGEMKGKTWIRTRWMEMNR